MYIVEKQSLDSYNLPIDNKYDLIVIIPVLNEKNTISNVIQTVDRGLQKYNQKGLIIVSDGGSVDGTIEILKNTDTSNDSIAIIDKNNGGKGGAIKDGLKLLKNIDFTAVLTIDGDLISITEDWIYKLSKPIFDGWDITNAFYVRGKCDAIITRNIIYPINVAYYNLPLKEPLAGERAYSKRFIDNIDIYSIPSSYGIDIHLLMQGYDMEMSIYEVNLGKRIHASAKRYNNFGYRIKRMFFEVTSIFSKILSDIKPRYNIKVHLDNHHEYNIEFDSSLDIDTLKKELNDLNISPIDDEEWIEILQTYIIKSKQNLINSDFINEFYKLWVRRLIYNCSIYKNYSIIDVYRHIDSFSLKLKEKLLSTVISGPGGI